MCHGDDSRPPAPPVSTGVAAETTLGLTASDGAPVLAYAATPQAPTGAGIVILPDVRGLHVFYRELAKQFADAGIHAVAIDYYGRTAQTTDRTDAGFDWKAHFADASLENVTLDVGAGVGYLRAETDVRSVFTVGFCYGGAASWRQAAEGHGLAGAIGFYGGSPLTRVGDRIPHIAAPLLMLLAGVDSTPPEEFEEFARQVRETGSTVEAHTYPGAPHSFFDRAFGEHRDACTDAWRRILAFVDTHRE